MNSFAPSTQTAYFSKLSDTSQYNLIKSESHRMFDAYKAKGCARDSAPSKSKMYFDNHSKIESKVEPVPKANNMEILSPFFPSSSFAPSRNDSRASSLSLHTLCDTPDLALFSSRIDLINGFVYFNAVF